ncbi:beta-glucosidase [Halioglobus maricola]|uniref:Beta-glucosidase n=1 Tax=Halioglobus maricola TaxID=2601894 RepID=A0A5P9NIU2_9GAMM|nr:GH1 family beta-glucosidase [Halioglobus maricola]QFU75446.1 beta-glucosidase [Halioglobus maricola]
MPELIFPKDFVFGTATAAYQIEGAYAEDGRGLSIWDEFSHRKGKTHKGDNGDVACDHYHRYPEDIALMGELGVNAYRMSLSWSRILPEGTGKINQAGINHYRREFDALLEAGITPYVTLFHWDLPLALHNKYGGFQNRQAAHDFAEYAEVAAKAFGDQVKHWITLNEPWEHCVMGHFMGEHAPGYHRPWTFMKVMHNLLLGHALGMERIRDVLPDATVGITTSHTPAHPFTDRDKDHEAAALANEFLNFVTLDPLYKGHYPEELSRRFRYFKPGVETGDMERINAPIDFIGVNNYQREFARHTYLVPFLNTWIVGGTQGAERDFVKDGVQHTSMGWEVYPEAIYEVLGWLRNDYDNPTTMITENGAAFEDEVIDGEVHDPKRMDFLEGYMGQVKRAMDHGSDITGYFVWTLIDNFEWAAGFAKRFGIIHVDHQTQERIIKGSGRWYADLIRRSQAQ